MLATEKKLYFFFFLRLFFFFLTFFLSSKSGTKSHNSIGPGPNSGPVEHTKNPPPPPPPHKTGTLAKSADSDEM